MAFLSLFILAFALFFAVFVRPGSDRFALASFIFMGCECLFTGTGLWLLYFLAQSFRDSRKCHGTWVESARKRFDEIQDCRIRRLRNRTPLWFQVKKIVSASLAVFGLFFFFYISDDAKAAYKWNHPGTDGLFFLLGLATAYAVLHFFVVSLFEDATQVPQSEENK